jgi:hypothetical protein
MAPKAHQQEVMMIQLESLKAEMGNLRTAAQLLFEEIEAIEREVVKLSESNRRTRSGNGRTSFIGNRGKRPATRLEVHLRGESYSSRCAADTLADIVMVIGPERIEPLGLRLGGHPLVSRTCPADSRGHRKRGSWYIYIHSDTAAKKAAIEQIGRALGLPISVRVVP